MLRCSPEPGSRSSSGQSSADSSDLDEDSCRRFSRVLVVNDVNDDSLTSDNDAEDNADSDSGLPATSEPNESTSAGANDAGYECGRVVLKSVRHLDDDAYSDGAGHLVDADGPVLLRALRSIDPDEDDSAAMLDSLEVGRASAPETQDSIELAAELEEGAAAEGDRARGGANSPSPSDSCSTGVGSAAAAGNSQRSCAQEAGDRASGGGRVGAAAEQLDGSMAKSRKKWQIPASFDIKGLPSAHVVQTTPAQLQLVVSPETDVEPAPSEDGEQPGLELELLAPAAAPVYVDDEDDKEYIVITGAALELGQAESGAGIRPPAARLPDALEALELANSTSSSAHRSLVAVGSGEGQQPVNAVASVVRERNATSSLAPDRADRRAPGPAPAAAAR